MNKKELNSLLSKAKKLREYGEYAEVLAILHQVVNEYPEDKYYYLLASSYFEAHQIDPALEYANMSLELNDQNKEAYQLKGLIYEKEEKYELAKEMYSKSLAIDFDFFGARDNLIRLLFFKEKKYDETIQQCEFVFSYKQFPVSSRKEVMETMEWLIALSFPLYSSYIYTGAYQEAISTLLKKKEIQKSAMPSLMYELSKEDRLLYKLYFLINDEKGIEEYSNLWLTFYKVPHEKLERWKIEALENNIL